MADGFGDRLLADDAPEWPPERVPRREDVESALVDLYGLNPRPFLRPAIDEVAPSILAEFRERWEEVMQDPDAHRLRILGVSDEEHDRAEWERNVRNKLDSALLALAEGWGYEWDKPYEYVTSPDRLPDDIGGIYWPDSTVFFHHKPDPTR